MNNSLNQLKFSDSNLHKLGFPADIGRKPASAAHGSRQRLHDTPAKAGFAGDDAYAPANEAADGATWRRPYGSWRICVTIQRQSITVVFIYIYI